MEDFCVHAQKFLIMILNNKVIQHWIICTYTQIFIDVEVFFLRTCAETPYSAFGFTKSSNAGLFAHICISLIETRKVLRTCAETPNSDFA